MHILIIPSEHLMTEKVPLGGIFQYRQAKALASSNYKVGMIGVGFITLRHLFQDYPYISRETQSSIEIFRCYKSIFVPHRYYPFTKLKNRYINVFLKTFAEYVAQYGVPDVVHAHNFLYAGFIAHELKRKYNIPYILTEHSSKFARNMIPSRLDNELKKVAQEAAFLTCVSGAFKSILEQRLSFEFEIIHNVIDDVFFKPEDITKDEEYFRFLNVASLDNNKNHSILIRAFASTFKGQNAILTIIGDGPLKRVLLELASDLRIRSQIRFLGRLAPEQVREEMRSSDCFVLSSNYETFGVVLIEALACGLPLVSTKCGGPQDIVSKDNGILVDVGEQGQLEEALSDMFRNHDNFSSDILINEAKKRFSGGEFIKRMADYYERTVSDRV